MPKGFEAWDLYGRPMQLLEVLDIVDSYNAGGQRIRRGQRKANRQHVEQIFDGAFSASLLNAFLTGTFGEVLGKTRIRG